MTEHREHVIWKVFEAVDPGHRHGLQADGGEQGEAGSVVLQETEDVNPALKYLPMMKWWYIN